MKNYLNVGGGLLTIISMFLPFLSVLSITTKGTAMGGVAWFYVVCGALIVIVGLSGKKMLNILSLLLGLIVLGLAAKYNSDTRSLGGKVEIGLWLMLLGGILAVIGSIVGLVKKAA